MLFLAALLEGMSLWMNILLNKTSNESVNQDECNINDEKLPLLLNNVFFSDIMSL